MNPGTSLENMDIYAADKTQLITLLSNSDISVPPRNEGRTKEHVERWSLFRVLATLAEAGMLAYPLSTKKSERPDYVVTQGNMLTGFEITEAINPQYAQAQSLPEAQDKKKIIDAGYFKWGQKYSLDKLRDITSRTNLSAPPWVGNDVEREYAQMISDVVKKKTVILNKAGFNRYQKNNLVIYVNQILPILVFHKATELCSEVLQNYWEASSFDNVYVECYSKIHHYCKKGVKVMPLNNLWK